jgi:predicted GH43/DUF377 family glycosyl hydrolase
MISQPESDAKSVVDSDDWGPLVGPWERYNENPVTMPVPRERGGQNGPQTVVYFQGDWCLFVMCTVDGEQNTILLKSHDGLHWERSIPYPVLKVTEDYEGNYALTKSAVIVGDELRLYYFGKVGIEERLCLATTTDLITFKKYEKNPIFTVWNSKLEGERVFPDSVVRDESTWYHYYDIGFGYKHPEHPRAYVICVATSKDGIYIDEAEVNPVVVRGSEGAWDSAMVSQASVVEIDNWWYMLFSGQSSKNYNKDGQAFGLARSKHPMGPWEKYPNNPVFTATGNDGDWDGSFVQHACPVIIDGRWRLYYNGHGTEPVSYRVGVAFGRDVS